MSQILKVVGHFVAAGKPRKWGEGNYATNFWIDIDKDETYPTMGEFEVYKDKVDLSKFSKGDKVEVSYNIKGAKRTWEDKKTKEQKSGFFQTLDAWKVETVGSSPTPPAPKHEDEQPDDLLPF